MRSTNLVLILVLINVAAGIVTVAAPVDVAPSVGGGSEIDSTKENISDRQTNRPASDELIGAFFGLGQLLSELRNIIFYGPQMLANLGVPAVITNGFQIVLSFVVACDVVEGITGRVLS